MNDQQAREILLRYRPGTADESDREVQEALNLAAKDPELSVWLEAHRAFQRTVITTHRETPVPEGLREQILSEIPVRIRDTGRRRRFLMVGIAGILILFGLLLTRSLTGPEENRFATYRLRMIKASLRGYAMDVETGATGELRTFLMEQNAPATWKSPADPDNLPLLGGAVLKWQGRPATMICYGREKRPELWLFIVNNSALPDPPSETTPVFAKVNRLNTMSWSRDGLTYILAGERNDRELRAMQ